MRSLAFAVAVGAMALLPSGNAGAFPTAPGAGASTDTNVLQVRDGCGPGLRYSYRAGGCVQDFAPPPPVYVRPAYPPPPPPRFVCPPGQRWSGYARRCVWM